MAGQTQESRGDSSGLGRLAEHALRIMLAALSTGIVSITFDQLLGARVTSELIPSPVVMDGSRVSIAVLGLVGLVGLVVAEFTFSSTRRKWFVPSVSGVSVLLCVALYVVGQPAHLESPGVVEGKVDAPNQLVAYLFVRPVGQGTCWLQSPAPLLLSPNGHWQAEVYLGGPPGERFEIWAVVSGDTIREFGIPDGYPCTHVPRTADRAVKTVVSR